MKRPITILLFRRLCDIAITAVCGMYAASTLHIKPVEGIMLAFMLVMLISIGSASDPEP